MRRRTEAKRNTILAVARQLFRKKGYQNTSMSEITEKVGGSKATIYGYFKSKKLLFEAVMSGASLDARGKKLQSTSTDSPVPIVPMENYRQIILIMDELTNSTDDVRTTLTRFGRNFLATICQPEFIEIYRLAVEASSRTEIGARFYEAGPTHAIQTLAAYLQACIDKGELRQTDVTMAACNFYGLLRSSLFERQLLNPSRSYSRSEVTEKARDTAEAFLRIYGPEQKA